MATTLSNGALDYSEALWDTICFQLSLGNSLRKVCAMEGMPCLSAAWKWRTVYPYAESQYALAKIESANSDQDKIEAIAEKVLTGEYEPNAARVAINAIQWCASKKMPKVYGDLHLFKHEVDPIKIEHGITVSTQSLLGNIGHIEGECTEVVDKPSDSE